MGGQQNGGGLGNLLGGLMGGNNNSGQQLIPDLGSMLNGGQQQQQQAGLGEFLRSIPRRGVEIIHGLMNGVRGILPGGRSPQQDQPGSRNPMEAASQATTSSVGSFLNLRNPFAAQGMENRPESTGFLYTLGNGQPLRALGIALNLDKLNGLKESLTSSRSGAPLDGLTQGLQRGVNGAGQQLSQGLSGILPNIGGPGVASQV